MKTDDATGSEHPTQPVPPAKCGPEPPAASEALRAELEALRQRVRQLEEDRARDRQALAELEAERDAYKRVAYHWALEQVREEDLKRYGQIEDGLELEDFIEELEQIVQEGEDA